MGTDGNGGVSSVFADRDALDAPVADSGLSAALAALRSTLSPVLDGESSATAVLYQPSGASPTTALAAALDGAAVCSYRCTPKQSAYDLGTALANELGAGVPTSGLSFEDVRAALSAAVADRDRPLVLVFDDVDRLSPSARRTVVTDLLAPLLSPGVAIVAVSATLAFRNDLSATERAVLCDRELPVATPDPADRRTAVDRLLEDAFDADAIADGVVDAAVSAGANGPGDVRTLLATAGERADEAGAERLKPEHVRAAGNALATDRLRERLAPLSEHERVTLGAVARLAREDALPARFRSVHERYVDRCEETGRDPNTDRSVQNYLTTLADLALVDSEQVRTDDGGQYYRYELAVDPVLLSRALEE